MIEQMGREEFYNMDRTPEWGGYDSPIESMGEPHLACLLLLDVSASMAGDAIDSLNGCIAQFKQQVCMDPIAKKRVDVAVVTFGDEVEVIQEFVPIDRFQAFQLSASGLTNMADGIHRAIDMVNARTKKYRGIGVPFHKSWIFMITDGASTSSEEEMERVAERIRIEEGKGSHNGLKFWAIGVDRYDKAQLFALTKRVVELRQHNFANIFDWLAESMSTISNSQVDDDVTLTILPEDARKAQMDRDVSDW